MKRAGWSLLVPSLALAILPAPRTLAAGPDPWAGLRSLLGEWTTEESPGKARFRFGFDLEAKAVVGRGRFELPETLDRTGVFRERLTVIRPDEPAGGLRGSSWDSDGKASTFSVQASQDGKSLTFVEDRAADGAPGERVTYTLTGNDSLKVDWTPGKVGEGSVPPRSYSARRTPRSAIGLDLPKGYVCYKAKGKLTADGKLEEPDWKSAPWTDSFVDIEGDLKPRPRFSTRAKMLWDDEYFYVAALAEEPHVWGTLTKHDSVIFQDNDFEIFIDPDGDNHEYYEIEINALNTEWDLFLGKPYRDGGPAVNEWEIPGLKTGVHVAGTLNRPDDVDQYWSVEFAIPWKVLAEYAHRPSPPREGDQWRVNFSRVEWQHEVVDGKYRKVPGTREDNWVWSAQGYIDMHKPEYWGIVQFSAAAPGKATFRPDPASVIRDRLMDVYNAQNAYRGKNKKLATRLDDLTLPYLPPDFPEHSTSLLPAANGYEAEITFNPSGTGPQTWTIRQDSKIVRKP